jgi:hypothetical protein
MLFSALLRYAFSAYASQSKVSVLAGSDGEHEVVEGERSRWALGTSVAMS